MLREACHQYDPKGTRVEGLRSDPTNSVEYRRENRQLSSNLYPEHVPEGLHIGAFEQDVFISLEVFRVGDQF